MADLLAAQAVIDRANAVLDNISESYYENNEVYAFWNDWEARDQRARVEGTYNNGRFSREKRTLGFVNGKWYCCLKRDAAIAKGLRLD
jgi:hypothetical protein